ncbi:4-hydroxy-2-oxovalerate aldolase [Micromonospora inositola]|uniref:4-hydroxy-2-oxovalerate aldolase n=1 Tax=Micromonospora inositola TaxID=47865 RepID=A0A1C5K580_9ACTN|nr:4-hydroxy-2-oxovalerate aldolase [Micromonospora inositola]SCG77915.1 4-hydroxy 2-oxovalerate aldolase [Micromonospora inositola]
MSPITVCDSTLRDGSHAKSHKFVGQEVRDVVAALDEAHVPVIEVSHGDGLGGSSFNYGFSEQSEFDLLKVAVEAAKTAKIAVLLVPGIGVKADLQRAADIGVSVARVATHCTEADISLQHLGLARDLGMTAVGFLMLAHMARPEELAKQATIMADAGAEIVYVTDSAGALTPSGVRDRVRLLRETLPASVEVGVHAHENLSLSVANSIAAVESGATWIDGCSCGLGAGAGNTPTEIFAAVCEQLDIETGIDSFQLMDAAEEVVRPVMPRAQVVDRAALLLGRTGLYSSFLLHAERASDRFGVPLKDLLIEVSKAKPVGGQEDLIVDVAARMASGRVG